MTPAVKAAERAGIEFTLHQYDHDPSHVAYGEEAAAALGLAPERVFKTLVIDAQGTLAVAIVPVMHRLALKACASALGAKRVAMAEPKLAMRATGYVVGGISPLGQRKRLSTLLDASAAGFATIFVSAGRRGLEIELDPSDLQTLTDATVCPLTET